MHPALLVAVLTAVWALAPFFGSPSSLWVMPSVAVVAAWGTRSKRRAVGASLASLLALVALWVAAGAFDGEDLVNRAGTGAALVAFHAPVVALLAAGAAWGAGRWRSRALSSA